MLKINLHGMILPKMHLQNFFTSNITLQNPAQTENPKRRLMVVIADYS